MERSTLNKIGIGAAILLAPGGFILGATLLARRAQKARAAAAAEAAEAQTEAEPAASPKD